LIQLGQQLLMAYEDYKYLLNRGYNRKPALDLISSRYNLDKKSRLLLYRCIHSDEEIQHIRSKSVKSVTYVILDGYNLALTLLSLIYGDEIFLCDDGFYRDLGLGKRKNNSEEIFDMLVLLSEYLDQNKIKFEIILDSQISRSGELAGKLRYRGIYAKTVRKTDLELILSNNVICTNDFLVLNRARQIYNLLAKFIKDSGLDTTFSFYKENL